MKSMNDIREILCEEIDKLRSGATTPKHTNAIVSVTGKLLATVKMEIDYAKAMGKRPLMKFIELEEPKLAEGAPPAEPPAPSAP